MGLGSSIRGSSIYREMGEEGGGIDTQRDNIGDSTIREGTPT